MEDEPDFNEYAMEDGYPMYMGFLYVVDGKIIEADQSLSVHRFKQITGAKEVKNCNIYERRAHIIAMEHKNQLKKGPMHRAYADKTMSDNPVINDIVISVIGGKLFDKWHRKLIEKQANLKEWECHVCDKVVPRWVREGGTGQKYVFRHEIAKLLRDYYMEELEVNKP